MRLTVAIAVACLIGGMGVADESRAAIRALTNIPAQNLGAALKRLAQDRDLQVVYFSRSIDTLSTQGAVGELTTDEAFTRLLAGTGLTYRYLDDKTVTIVPAPTGGKVNATETRVAPAATNTPAASTESAESLPGSEPVQLTEVIVTAQKRAERLLDVPQSVSVLSADDLFRMDATQFRDFASTVPGLTFTTVGAGVTQISMRGVTVGLDISPTVGVYVDEVPYGSSSAFTGAGLLALDAALFDLDRVEVLRGPQGTLYGASAMGGLLKYVTKTPDSTRYGGEVRAGISGTQHGDINYNVAGAVNAPLMLDKLALRVSGFESHDGGYIDNVTLGDEDINRSDTYGGRVDLSFTPTDALSIRVTGFLQNITRDGEATADYTSAGIPLVGSLEQVRPLAGAYDQRFRVGSATIGYDLKWAELTSISSYQSAWSQFIRDSTPTRLPTLIARGQPSSAGGTLARSTTDKIVQEVRLAASGGRPLEWVLGGFYTHENSRLFSDWIRLDLAGQPAPNTLFTSSIPSIYEEYAAFGDVTWHLTDKLDVTGGVRYSSNHQERTQFGSGALATSQPTIRRDEDVFTYLANTRYHFSSRAVGYVRYATGYRPGGPNFIGIDPATGESIGGAGRDSDRLKSYEAGFKAETAARRFGADIAVYYLDWSNIQVGTVRGGFSITYNAPGGASVRGIELALTSRPTDELLITSALAYQDAHMSEADLDLRAAKGERLPNVPRFTGSLNADYAFSRNGLQPQVGASVRYISDRRASFDASTSFPQYVLPEFTTVDLRAGLTFGAISTQLYVRNLFDERGQLSALTFLGRPQPAILQPRTIGVSATRNF